MTVPDMNENNSTTRFSDRVQYYIKYRPKYPKEILDFFKKELKLSIRHNIADIGSGTGFLSRLFLQNGNVVYGVEPNKEMREAAEKLLRQYPNFKSINGSAEFTDLESGSVDFITAAQAFHWFDIKLTRSEFKRILKSKGWVVLIWNERTETSPFLEAYEKLLCTFAIDYTKVDHRNVDNRMLTRFFGSDNHQLKLFKNEQQFDFEGLKGRLLSSSYAPTEEHPSHKPMIAKLQEIFTSFQQNGRVKFEYNTKVHYGKFEK
jgi:SAM-dependent methyltransferase